MTQWTRKQVLADPVGAIAAHLPRILDAVEAIGTEDELHVEDPGLMIAAGYARGALLDAQKKIDRQMKDREDG